MWQALNLFDYITYMYSICVGLFDVYISNFFPFLFQDEFDEC